MKTVVRLLILSALALCLATSSREQSHSSKHNGDWWVGLEPRCKPDIVSGFVDGMYLGHHFSTWNYQRDAQGGDQSALSAEKKTETSFTAYGNKYLDRVTSSEVIEGLDSLYSDKENRKIHITYAVWIVLRKIAHDPDKDTQTLIKNSRTIGKP